MASSSQALLIKFTWLSDHHQVWAPLYKLKFWQFAAPEHSGVLTQCQRGKTSTMIFNKTMLLPINLASVKRPFPNNLLSTVWWIIHKRKTFKTCANLSRSACATKFNPRWDRAMLRDTATNPRAPFKKPAQTPQTNCHHGGGGMMIWAPCGHWVEHELLCISKCSRFKCEAICLTVKAWMKLSQQQDNNPKHSS